MSKRKAFPKLFDRSVEERLRRGFSEMEKYEEGEELNNDERHLSHHLRILDEEDLAKEHDQALFTLEEISENPALAEGDLHFPLL